MRRLSPIPTGRRSSSVSKRHAAATRPRRRATARGMIAAAAFVITLGSGGLAVAAAPLALGDGVVADSPVEAAALVIDVAQATADPAASLPTPTTSGLGIEAVPVTAAETVTPAVSTPADPDPAPETDSAADPASTAPEVASDTESTAEPDGDDPTTETVDDTTWTVTPGDEALADDDVPAVAAQLLRAAPQPGSTESVVVVSVVGARTAGDTKQPLAGVHLTGTLDNGTVFTCTSDADGDCAFTVPDTGHGQHNRREVMTITYTADDVPAGWYANTSLGVGSSSGGMTLRQYRMRTPQLYGGNTYTSGPGTGGATGFTGTANEVTTGGWQASVTNPSVPQQCGIKVAIVMDLSSSVTVAHVQQAKDAATNFVDALTGTPSSIGVYTFGTVAPATSMVSLGATPVSTAAGAQTVKDTIAQWHHLNSEGTNWDRGLWQMSGLDYDVIMFITDGSPTFYGNRQANNSYPAGPGGSTNFAVAEEAIASANTLKAEGTRVVAIGVGTGLSGDGAAANLRAISGQAAGSDYFQTANYAEAAAQLQEFASGACEQTVTVIKQTVPYTYDASTAPTLADGWTFTAVTDGGATFAGGATTATGVTGAGSQAGTGATEFRFEVPWTTATGTMTITETQQDGYTLVQQDGANATCYRMSDDGARVPVPVTNTADGGFTVAISAQNQISCYVINREAPAPATVTVAKVWKVDGQTYEGGAPEGLGMAAALTINNATATWGETVTGHRVGDTLTIGETTTITAMPGCTVTSAELTGTGLSSAVTLNPSAATTNVTLAAESNSYTLTNTVTCVQTLALDKQVDNSASTHAWATQAAAQDWTVSAVGTTTLSGTGAVNATQVPAGQYTLSETAAATLALPAEAYAAGEWQCTYTDGAGGQVAVNAGTVTVPRGRAVACTITNTLKAFPITWTKVDEMGAPLTGAEWTLTRSGMNSATVEVTGAGASPTIAGLPMGTYTLTETKAPPGYTKADPITFTISADGTVSGLPATVTNTKRNVPSLPLTGGLGTDVLLVGSGLLVIAALAAEAMRRRRAQMTSQ